jgi:hypothetical protein
MKQIDTTGELHMTWSWQLKRSLFLHYLVSMDDCHLTLFNQHILLFISRLTR